jgi:RND family efflux transporter MFP subunit
MRINQKRLLGMVGALALTTLGGAFAFHNMHSEELHYEQPADLQHPQEPLHPNGSEVVVRSFQVQSDTALTTSSQSFTGSLQPRFLSSMGFRISGKISERLVNVGDRVKKGQPLFRLDPTDYELQLRVAESDQISARSLLKQAIADESRAARLRPSGTISQADYDLSLASRDVAQARLDASDRRLILAKNQRQYCELVADEDGLITAIHAEVGQVVNIGQPVLQMMQGDELEVVVPLPENRVSDAKRLNAEARFWTHPNWRLRAELRELSPVADPISRTYDARFRLLDSLPELSIGMTASIHVNDNRDGGLVLPLTCLASQNQQPIVWRIIGNEKSREIEAVAVEVIQYRSDTIVIKGPLRDGDLIVSAGVQRLDKHARVRVWEAR